MEVSQHQPDDFEPMIEAKTVQADLFDDVAPEGHGDTPNRAGVDASDTQNGGTGADQGANVDGVFEAVLASHGRKTESTEPFYMNRAAIVAATAVVGILIGRQTKPAEVAKVIKPTTASSFDQLNVPEQRIRTALANPFRELKSVEEFDPWAPLNGGLPVPPQAVQAVVAANGAGVNSGVPNVPMPDSMRGSIQRGESAIPFNPGVTLLPDVNGNPQGSFQGSGQGSGQGKDNSTSQTGKLPPATGGKPTTENTAPAKQADQTAAHGANGAHYLAVTILGGDAESMQAKAAAVASQCAGSARKFIHVTQEGTAEQYGVLIVIPAENYAQARDLVIALSGASIESEQIGRPSARQSAISGILTARLKQLRDKRAELLVDFKEDAPAIKQIDEAIQQELRAVEAARVPVGNVAAIRVLIR